MSDKMREAAEVAVIDLREFQRMNPGFLSTGLFLLEEALAEQPAPSVPDAIVEAPDCPTCEGAGYVEDPKECSRCGMRGCRTIDCERCGGTGKLAAAPEVKS